MGNRKWVYAVIATLSFVLMTIGLVMAYANAGEGGPGLSEFGPSIALGILFFVNIVLMKQNDRR